MFSWLRKWSRSSDEPSFESDPCDDWLNVEALRAVEAESEAEVDRLVYSGFEAATLLALSLMQNKRKIAVFLIGKGTRLAPNKFDTLFGKLLSQALIAEDMTILDLGFRAGLDIHRRAADGYTPLEHAVQGRWPNAIEFLVSRGAVYNDISPYFWFTRCYRGPGMMINTLIELELDVPADIRAWGDVFKAEEANRAKLPKILED